MKPNCSASLLNAPKNAFTQNYWKSTEETYAKQESETEKSDLYVNRNEFTSLT